MGEASKAKSADKLLDDVAMHVRQTAVDAIVAKRQLLVVDAEQVEYGRVDVVTIGRLLRRLVRPLIARPIGHAALDAAADKPVCERERIVVAALAALRTG